MELLWVVVVNSYKCINETFTKKQGFDEKLELLIFEKKLRKQLILMVYCVMGKHNIMQELYICAVLFSWKKSLLFSLVFSCTVSTL